MSMISAFKASASGLAAERYRMDVISTNLANAGTMRVNGKDPYRRKEVVLKESSDGVQILDTVDDMSPFRSEHEPGSPLADSNGLVYYSNVEPITEMVDMIGASRAYEANLNAFLTTKQMIQSALDIIRA
jgi:flagellar basal-body rod protein FlgC